MKLIIQKKVNFKNIKKIKFYNQKIEKFRATPQHHIKYKSSELVHR
jgi:hypothetical protein